MLNAWRMAKITMAASTGSGMRSTQDSSRPSAAITQAAATSPDRRDPAPSDSCAAVAE